MTNENSSYIKFFPVNLTGSEAENKPAFGRRKYKRIDKSH
jgi:hypothetical protein